MASSVGGIVALQTRGCYYGIQGKLEFPVQYGVHGADGQNYFDAYFGFANPFAVDDPRVEAGIFKYGSRSDWTLFLSYLAKQGGWVEQAVSYPVSRRMHFKLIFVHNDASHISLYVDGTLLWSKAMTSPISQATYNGGGLQMKACLGMADGDHTVYFDRMQFSDLQVCADRNGQRWVPMHSIDYREVTKSPAPTLGSWYPLAASYKVNPAP